MTSRILLTRDHRHALDQAEERGHWRPLPIQRSDVIGVKALTCLGYGEASLKAIIEVHRFQEWTAWDGVPRLLPVLGAYIELPQPIPLGDSEQLLAWLPIHPHEVQILCFQALRSIRQLSDIRSIPGACTEWPITPAPLDLTGWSMAPGRLY
jgi:hypothetical protein